ncbi:hypothetical protein V6N13_058686 [Hibiscus sabdariffa]
MPPSALDRLASLQIDYLMLFELRNDAAERASHCGVLEFITEEVVIYMPYWMMENLLLQEGDIVKVKNAKLESFTLEQGATNFAQEAQKRSLIHRRNVLKPRTERAALCACEDLVIQLLNKEGKGNHHLGGLN